MMQVRNVCSGNHCGTQMLESSEQEAPKSIYVTSHSTTGLIDIVC